MSREHTESKDCWCQPLVTKLCPECDGSGCSICDSGLIESDTIDSDLIIIHKHCLGCEYYDVEKSSEKWIVCTYPPPKPSITITQQVEDQMCSLWELDSEAKFT